MTITHTVRTHTVEMIVSPEQYSPIAARFSKIVARCEKKDYPAPTLELVDVFSQRGSEVLDGGTFYYERGDRKIKLSLPTITVDGWTLVARVDFMDTDSGPRGIVSTVPGQTAPEWAHDIDTTCEHCHKHRRRNRIFIFENESGDYRRVGSTCIEDYMGLDAAMLLHCTEGRTWYESDEEGIKAAKWWSVQRFVATARTLVRKSGFQKSKDDNPTWLAAYWLRIDLARPHVMDPEKRREWTPTEEDERFAADAIEHFRNQRSARSDYVRNLSVVAECAAVDFKRLPLTASMAVAYERVLERRVAEEKARQEAGGEVGEIGDKVQSVAVKVASVRTFEGGFGPTTVYTLVDAQNHNYVWFSSRQFDDVQVGAERKITGRIKDHKEFRGVPQTVLTRCKWA